MNLRSSNEGSVGSGLAGVHVEGVVAVYCL